MPVPREPARELRATGTHGRDTSPVLPERVAVRFPACQRENRVKTAKRLDSAPNSNYDSGSQHTPGEVAEWSIAPVLKTGNP